MNEKLKEKLKKKALFLPPPFNTYFAFRSGFNVSFWRYLKFIFKSDKRIYWPVHPRSEVSAPDNIYVGINTNAGTRPGCYIQGFGGIYLGDYVRMANNVGIISGNHDFYNHLTHTGKEVRIGDYSWIGMGAVILPGVILGPRTIVGAGSVVTKSFPDGFCIIAGNPARLIKTLDKEKFVPTRYRAEFYGFIPRDKFIKFARRHLKNNKYIKKEAETLL